MSGIVAALGDAAAARPGEAPAGWRQSVATLARACGPVTEEWSDPEGSARFVVCARDWEREGRLMASERLAVSSDLVVAADAALYYRHELRRALATAGAAPAADAGAAALVLAAWRTWGADAIARLEGDFSVVIWDRRTRTLAAARDFAGSRTLFLGDTGAGLLVASTRGAVAAHPRVDGRLDVRALAEAACGFAAMDGTTCYRGVREVRAGETVAWSPASRPPRTIARWAAPEFEQGGGAEFAEAAVELRRLLEDAVAERTPASGATVWLSGGWDSTAVFAAGRSAAEAGRTSHPPASVSISYPPGDSGREDELIRAVLDRWGTAGRWIQSADIPFLPAPLARAAERDEPFAHPYEEMHRALARASVAGGARVAFGGYGGDQLFYVSHVFFADLLRRGQLPALRRSWREKGSPGAAHFWRFAVAPNVPASLYRIAEGVLGRPVLRTLERGVPPWIAPDFSARTGLAGAGRRGIERRRGERHGSHESRWMIESPFFHRALAATTTTAHAEGVDWRSPLFDRRIVEFAARRPRWERSSGRNTKLLLRASMRGLLPPEVLAPRASRTGTSESYMRAACASAYPGLVQRLTRDSRLADLGIVDPAAWRAATDRALGDGGGDDVVRLYFTLQAELWLRAREGAAATSGAAPRAPLWDTGGSRELATRR